MNARLQTIASLIENNLVVADVGTDHAYLPIDLIQSGRISRAIASDIGKGPLATARANVTANGLNEQIDLRLGSGLAPFKMSEVDIFVIAGMGGHTIADILHADAAKARAAQYLILQPMQNRPFLRRYLYDNAYHIVSEAIAQEGSKYYHILKVVAQSAPKPTEFDLTYGVNVVKDASYYSYLEHLIDQKFKLASHLKSASQEIKYSEIISEVEKLKGVFNARNRK